MQGSAMLRRNGCARSLMTSDRGMVRAFDMRRAGPADAAEITRIDAAGLATGHASFRAHAHDWQSFEAGFVEPARLVAQSEVGLAGWAGVSRTSARDVYRGVGEVSVYICPHHSGQGVGSQMLGALIAAAEDADFWTLTAQIFPENTASIRLHQNHGFTVLGTRRALGKMSYGPFKGRWRDVIFLERRSVVVGT